MVHVCACKFSFLWGVFIDLVLSNVMETDKYDMPLFVYIVCIRKWSLSAVPICQICVLSIYIYIYVTGRVTDKLLII